MIDTDANLQYKLSLAIAGMSDGRPSHIPSIQRLAMLRAHQKAWSTLQWEQSTSVVKLEHTTWELFGK
jgi:hypothetical protein